MVGVVLQRVEEYKARTVIVVPDLQQTWYPMLSAAIVRSRKLADLWEEGVFYRTNHQYGEVSFAFKRWAMRAVEVSFDENGV